MNCSTREHIGLACRGVRRITYAVVMTYKSGRTYQRLPSTTASCLRSLDNGKNRVFRTTLSDHHRQLYVLNESGVELGSSNINCRTDCPEYTIEIQYMGAQTGQ